MKIEVETPPIPQQFAPKVVTISVKTEKEWDDLKLMLYRSAHCIGLTANNISLARELWKALVKAQ